jgi:hypothetical protein
VVIFAELGVKKFDRLVTLGRCKHPHPALLHPRPYAVHPEIVSSRQGDASIPTLLHTSPAPTRMTTRVVTGGVTVAADPARIILLALPR